MQHFSAGLSPPGKLENIISLEVRGLRWAIALKYSILTVFVKQMGKPSLFPATMTFHTMPTQTLKIHLNFGRSSFQTKVLKQMSTRAPHLGSKLKKTRRTMQAQVKTTNRRFSLIHLQTNRKPKM